jgi:hypothetical protein
MSQEFILPIVKGKIEEWEAKGHLFSDHKKINDDDLLRALHVELVQTKEEMERLSKEILELDWRTFDTTGASYARLSTLLKKYRRHTGLDD